MSRKDDHINLALNQPRFVDNGLSNIKLPYNQLITCDYDKISLKTSFFNREISAPILINAMSGGCELSYEVNKKLAKIAKHFNIPMVTGSMNVLLKSQKHIESFKVIREYNPDGIVILNVNANTTISELEYLLKIMPVDGIEIHLNPLQELMMPEGDRVFSNRLKNLKEILKLDNVIVKEVGFGMSELVIENLVELGAKYIDISGKGGTNFAWIENSRAQHNKDLWFEDFGYTTCQSLLNAQSFLTKTNIIASGGIGSSLDIVKSLVLGAKIVGMSYYFLDLVVNKSFADSIAEIEVLLTNIQKIMALLGTEDVIGLNTVLWECACLNKKTKKI